MCSGVIIIPHQHNQHNIYCLFRIHRRDEWTYITYRLALWSNVSPLAQKSRFLTCLGSIPAEIIRETASLSPLLHASKMSSRRRAILQLQYSYQFPPPNMPTLRGSAHNQLATSSCNSRTHSIGCYYARKQPHPQRAWTMHHALYCSNWAGHGAAPFELSTKIKKMSQTTENQNSLWTQHQKDNLCTVLYKEKNWLKKMTYKTRCMLKQEIPYLAFR